MKTQQYPHAPHAVQHRMVQSGALLTLDGRLMEAGYATGLIKRYDRDAVRASKLRIKEWDYYLVGNDHAALAVTVADLGYAGMDSLSVMDFDEKAQHTVSRLSPFPMGKRGLPPSSTEGVVRARGKHYEITFRKTGAQRHIYGHMYDFDGMQKPLLFDIILHEPPGDSMVIATPFKRHPRKFYYNQKINCMPAEGRVIYGEREYVFSAASAFGVLDWGRGVWTYSNTWYWASASGVVQGHRFGMNLGYGFGDTTAATENMLFCDGVAHKLGHVTFDIPRDGRKEDFLKPWRVHDDQGRLELTFEPILDRAARVNALVIRTDQHQVFGRFNGKARLDDGRVLDIRDLIGFAEKVKNRY